MLMFETPSPGCLKVLVGENALENERLSASAAGTDMWFHAAGVPGAHVILCIPYKKYNVNNSCIQYAASLAIKYSKGGRTVNVCRAVDVDKQKGTPTGQVSIKNYWQI